MSTTLNVSSEPIASPSLSVPSPNLSPSTQPSTANIGTSATAAAPLASPTSSSQIQPSSSPSATLSVPKAMSTKPSRQTANNADRSTAAGGGGGGGNPLAGLPSGLTPAALSLSPGAGGGSRLGTRSPSSIPSSPTSIHSSSSAIFERDIEPLGLPSLSIPVQNAPTSSSPLRSSTNTGNSGSSVNPHRIPRSKTTEALELTVPSVLDSAVSALSSAEESGANITVLSPIPAQPLSHGMAGSTVQSPLSLQSQPSPLSAHFNQHPVMGSGTSAGSPSPPTMSLLLQGMGMSGLMSASASVSGAASASGFQSGFASPLSSSRAPSPARSASPPNGHFSTELSPSAIGGSPRSITKDAPSSVITSSPLKKPSLPAPAPTSNPGMPSPNMRASNRLSFISYTDLLTSAPIASQSLGAVLNPGSHEPPAHLVVVDADNTSSLLGMTPTVSSGHLPLGSLNMSGATDKIDVDSLGTVGLSSTGEWGREGLGSGLEERLERLWVAEKELNERGRVAIPVSPTSGGAARGSASRSASMGGRNASPPIVATNALPPLGPPAVSVAPPAAT